MVVPQSDDDYESTYAVKLHCESCVDSLSQALKPLDGIKKFDISLNDQKVQILGNLPPSVIIQQIQEKTGKDAIIRGMGNLNSAAVCILESFNEDTDRNDNVKGLARIVSIKPNEILVDLTINGVSQKGDYFPTFRESGNIWKGALTTGKSLFNFPKLSVSDYNPLDKSYSSQDFYKVPLDINDLIGRSLCVSRDSNKVSLNDLCGVIARSAGVWENDKQVCSCTGKTIWEERKDAVLKGIN